MERAGHPVERARPGMVRLLDATRLVAWRGPMRRLGGTLLAIDLAFALLQIAVVATDYGFRGAYRLSLETELGVAQVYGFAQIGTAAFLLVVAWRRFGSPQAALWAGVLVYVALDDAWTIHERLGAALVEWLDLGSILGLRSQDFGELLAYSIIGAVALAALVLSERRSMVPAPSVLTTLMIPVVGLLVFFAVVVDIAGNLFMPDLIGIAIEDGGELIAMTIILVATWVWTDRADELAAEL